MGFNIFNQQLPNFALHVGATDVHAVQLKSVRGSLALQAITSKALPKDAVTADAFVKSDLLTEAINQLIAHPAVGAFTTKLAAVTIPESKSFVRVIQIPVMVESEIENAILFEVEAYIPLPIEQVYFDWQIVRTIENHFEVLVIAAPKIFIDNYLEILHKAGLQVVAIETESQSLQRALLPQKVTETVLIVDFDTHRINMVMVVEGALQFTSSIPVAEAVIADSALGNVATEIQNIMQFHYNHSPQKISRIILSGVQAAHEGLATALLALISKSYEGTAVVVADPWTNFSHLKNQPLNQAEALSCATAIGLALRNFQK